MLTRRLLSLSGVVPLGGFLVLHLALNLRALAGAPTFARATHFVDRVPGIAVIEWLFIFAPLLLHAALGVGLTVRGVRVGDDGRYPPNVRAAMRATGVVAIAFLAMHLPELRFHAASGRLGGGELATLLAADLSTTYHGVPWRGLAYLGGTACVVFHFAAGLWGFLSSTAWGSVSSRPRRLAWGVGVLGVVLWLGFADVVVDYATGSAWLGSG